MNCIKEFKLVQHIESSDIIPIGTIFYTTNFSIFKYLEGNREISDAHVHTLKESIIKNGYVPVPILVNEDYYIIDGQHRVKACKELGIGIYFICIKEADIVTCAAINEAVKNWQTKDRYNMYQKAPQFEDKHEHYDRYLNIIERLQKLGINSISVAQTICFGSPHSRRGEDVISGELIFTEEERLRAIKEIEYLEDFISNIDIDWIKRRGGGPSVFFSAFIITSRFEGVDKKRLAKKVTDILPTDKSAWSSSTIYELFEKWYNTNLPAKNHVFIGSMYKESKANKKAEAAAAKTLKRKQQKQGDININVVM